MNPNPPVLIATLAESDIEEIMAIEKKVFVSHWPESAFMNELNKNRMARYFVARQAGSLVGYGGIWLVIDEAHITTLAVHENHRRKKIGEQLLCHLLSVAVSLGAHWATLEVRESNQAAQELYKKFGFSSVGTRKNYYQEEMENAVIMRTGNLQSEKSKQALMKIKEQLELHPQLPT